MKEKQIQQRMFKALLNGKEVRYQQLNQEEICISCDGLTAYIFNTKDIMFNLSKCTPCDFGPVFNEQEYTPAEMLETARILKNGTLFVRELCGADCSIFVDNKLLSEFTEPEFYVKAPKDPILIKEFCQPAGIVMPIRVPLKGEKRNETDN